ncbi:helix-turn-helix transcriptional regulator [Saccharopolyspora hirsuta]|uniref:Helix-turn-helix transcriptional regulator n=1 Tax=Saccharopolyspora hirsuta TaxID=1837 RepID=A0A5M7CA46_SACHI|nr:AraC family transcriptional regulator [Saccharopolyspora hirsuta]KAA5838270.1 helix-turn-helix transcriptional regulator [Saccharopolyspora hirsuta]
MVAELGLRETHGILGQPWVEPTRTSAGLGWPHLYLSTQRELPYRAAFDGAATHLVILHLDGLVTVRRGKRFADSRRIAAGGLFLHPADRELSVELGGELRTVHVYLSDAALQEAADGPVELAEEFGGTDPLLEQLVLSLDEVVRNWEPSARTYVDQLGCLLGAHLARHHSTRRPALPEVAGLADRQLDEVQELMRARLREPLPLADLAAVAGLSVSQFARRFKARTGMPPHRYLVRLRLEQACRLLRTSAQPIAEIAVASGFSHQEHLTRVMRARLGTTPAEVRRSG